MFMTPPEFANSLTALPFTSKFSRPHVRKKECNTLSLLILSFQAGTTAILVSSFFNHFRVKNTFSLFKSHTLFILKRVFIKVLKLFECISNHCRTCSYCGFFFTQRILFHLPQPCYKEVIQNGNCLSASTEIRKTSCRNLSNLVNQLIKLIARILFYFSLL